MTPSLHSSGPVPIGSISALPTDSYPEVGAGTLSMQLPEQLMVKKSIVSVALQSKQQPYKQFFQVKVGSLSNFKPGLLLCLNEISYLNDLSCAKEQTSIYQFAVNETRIILYNKLFLRTLAIEDMKSWSWNIGNFHAVKISRNGWVDLNHNRCIKRILDNRWLNSFNGWFRSKRPWYAIQSLLSRINSLLFKYAIRFLIIASQATNCNTFKQRDKANQRVTEPTCRERPQTPRCTQRLNNAQTTMTRLTWYPELYRKTSWPASGKGGCSWPLK